MDQFDRAAIQDFLLDQFSKLKGYQKFVEDLLKENPCGSIRMERTKAILMQEYVEMMLSSLAEDKEE
jgi:hypothetical protein